MQEHADDSFMLNLLFAERFINCELSFQILFLCT